MSDPLQVIPETELHFKWELRKTIPTNMTLKNVSEVPVAFKVKTTSPKRYSVRPSSGVVYPKDVVEIQLAMQMQKEVPQDLDNCRDKFLIQSVQLPQNYKADAAGSSPEFFDKSSRTDIIEKKLKVVLQAPAKPPSPVPEEPTQNDHYSNDKYVSNSRNTGDVTRLVQTNNDLQQQIKRLQLQIRERGLGGDISQQDKSFNIMHLAMTAVLAFILGYFLAW